MKMPNGFGSVVKLGGKRRRPFAARITDGWEINQKTGRVRQKFKYIDYYESRTDALIGLAEFNKNPFDIDARKITFAEMYKLWSFEKFKIGKNDEASESLIYAYSAAFKNSKKLHDLVFIDIRAHHMQTAIDELKLGYSSKDNMRGLFRFLYEYAMKNDLIDKDYSQYIKITASKKSTSRKPFSDKSINVLWGSLDEIEIVDSALIMIYTGLRIGELLGLDKRNIDLEGRFLTGGLKTDAGKNRIVPLNKKIIPLFEKRKYGKGEFLFYNDKGKRLNYQAYLKKWKADMRKLKMTHKPHDCRHTFATLMDNAGANNVARKRIMGHAISDVTDGVYTHKNLDQLLIAIDLI